MPPIFRPISSDEQDQALGLWHAVFGVPRDYFARYYDADPWYRQGDTLGAWVDGALVSAVHLCRRPLAWEGAALQCGGIANVATSPAFRGRGLSRHLLSLVTARMQDQGFDFSTLGTGIPDFYAALGWEAVRIPRFELTTGDAQPPPEHGLSPATPTALTASLYSAMPRTLQQNRPEGYFDGWVGWRWASDQAQFLTLPSGYAVLDFPEGDNHSARVQEWRASDAATEVALLREAVLQAHRQRRRRVEFSALPQHALLSALEPLGAVEPTHLAGKMTRNVSLPVGDYERVRASYLTGQAALWRADGF